MRWGFWEVLRERAPSRRRRQRAETLESFLRCHLAAFAAFEGVPRSLLYDNLKTAVLERIGDVIRFHPRRLELAWHCHFAPRPVARARGNEKGASSARIDSSASRSSRRVPFILSMTSIDNSTIGPRASLTYASCRVTSKSAASRPHWPKSAILLPLPAHPLACDLVRPISSGKPPYLRFDANDYSIPHQLVRRPLTLVASDSVARVLDGDIEVARHARSWERKEQLEDPLHLRGLSDHKRHAREHRGRNRLMPACASAEPTEAGAHTRLRL